VKKEKSSDARSEASFLSSDSGFGSATEVGDALPPSVGENNGNSDLIKSVHQLSRAIDRLREEICSLALRLPQVDDQGRLASALPPAATLGDGGAFKVARNDVLDGRENLVGVDDSAMSSIATLNSFPASWIETGSNVKPGRDNSSHENDSTTNRRDILDFRRRTCPSDFWIYVHEDDNRAKIETSWMTVDESAGLGSCCTRNDNGCEISVPLHRLDDYLARVIGIFTKE